MSLKFVVECLKVVVKHLVFHCASFSSCKYWNNVIITVQDLRFQLDNGLYASWGQYQYIWIPGIDMFVIKQDFMIGREEELYQMHLGVMTA